MRLTHHAAALWAACTAWLAKGWQWLVRLFVGRPTESHDQQTKPVPAATPQTRVPKAKPTESEQSPAAPSFALEIQTEASQPKPSLHPAPLPAAPAAVTPAAVLLPLAEPLELPLPPQGALALPPEGPAHASAQEDGAQEALGHNEAAKAAVRRPVPRFVEDAPRPALQRRLSLPEPRHVALARAPQGQLPPADHTVVTASRDALIETLRRKLAQSREALQESRKDVGRTVLQQRLQAGRVPHLENRVLFLRRDLLAAQEEGHSALAMYNDEADRHRKTTELLKQSRRLRTKEQQTHDLQMHEEVQRRLADADGFTALLLQRDGSRASRSKRELSAESTEFVHEPLADLSADGEAPEQPQRIIRPRPPSKRPKISPEL